MPGLYGSTRNRVYQVLQKSISSRKVLVKEPLFQKFFFQFLNPRLHCRDCSNAFNSLGCLLHMSRDVIFHIYTE